MSNLTHFTKDELFSELAKLGEQSFRAKQIWNWIYARGAKSFEEMTNISKVMRENLTKNFSLERPQISKDFISLDGTRKFLVKFSDGREVEAVFIPEETRGTLCISSQVGCTLSCKFCHTGTQTLVRNLEFHEIVAQILLAKDLINDWDQGNRKLTNVVFMGMGEPFFNYENVAKAVKILNDSEGVGLSSRRVTISTSGLVPEILRSSTELRTNLAISLHATNDELRTDIMAINKKYPLKDLLAACKTYNRENPNQKITFEYVMLKEVNDHEEHARELIDLINKFNLNVKINLIPFNPWDGCGYGRSGNERIEKFQKILKNAGLISPIRKTRGDDVMAACGQLKSLSERQKNTRK
ncbi:MAG: 23S rRNA (adenine(2503)-C(2))-methyltransferase RlmN [Proteobacteria bacterium]|nr:23S rRNA (adenine(2503)-C(2))-methyltransferase RlmN [Pseudomonadota bacterium]